MTPRQRKDLRPTPSSFDEYPELVPLVSAKRMGLSFAELNLMSMSDFLDFTEQWADMTLPDDEETVRPATQADIDMLP